MKLILFLFFGTIFHAFVVAKFTSIFSLRNERTENKPHKAQHQNLFTIWSYDEKMVYEKIIEATEDFDDKHCIGVGAYGDVYKAELQIGQVIHVKKLHALSDDGIVNLKPFKSEIYALIEI